MESSPSRFTKMSFQLHKSKRFVWVVLLGLLTGNSMAQVPGQFNPSIVERYRQDEQIKEIRNRQEVDKNVNLSIPVDVGVEALKTDETPCFKIRHVSLKYDQGYDFSWIEKNINETYFKSELCIGVSSIGVVKNKIQNLIIHRGLVTTSVSIEPQDLKDGDLEFIIIPGKATKVTLRGEEESQRPLMTALAFKEGELLNIRDVEQTIENLERNPSAVANIEIEPGDNPGESEVFINYKQANRFRGAVSLDDSGSESSGRFQGSATLFIDAPANLNDSFYLTMNRSLKRSEPTDSKATIVHYSIPFGFYEFSITHSESRNNQKVAGANQDYSYINDQKDTELSVSRVIHRDQRGKTSIGISAFKRVRRNYIDDTEVEVQRRVIGGWSAEARHMLFLENGGSFNANISFDRGTGAFNAIPAPEEEFGEGTARFKIWKAGFGFNKPLVFLERIFQYQLNVRAQLNKTPLVQADHFVIGGRHTVRGFDGETVLSSERGWLARNDLSMPLYGGQLIPYLAIDHGAVSGPTSERLVGKSLTGGALGVKGVFKDVSYNFFMGFPIRKPDGFSADSKTFGFDLYYNF